MFEGQPKGLWALALANTGERFGYYTMIAVFALFNHLQLILNVRLFLPVDWWYACR